jgi:hypothetical protein
MSGGFLNALLGGLTGAGKGIAQQQQFRSQEADADLDRKLKGFQLAQMQAPAKKRWTWDTNRALFVSEDGETREVPGITAKAPAARIEFRDGQKIDLDNGTASPIAGYVAPQSTAQRNIDPLSPQGIKAAAERAVVVAQATPRPKSATRALPSSAVEKLVGIDNMMDMATQVRDGLQKAATNRTNVTGRIAGVIPTPSWVKNLAGVGGDEGKDVRAMLGNLYGTVAKERGGSALSAAEIKLLESYIPNENEDEHTATIKANRFIRTLRAMRENKIKAYQQFGFGVDDEAPTMDQPQYSPNNPFAKRP